MTDGGGAGREERREGGRDGGYSPRTRYSFAGVKEFWNTAICRCAFQINERYAKQMTYRLLLPSDLLTTFGGGGEIEGGCAAEVTIVDESKFFLRSEILSDEVGGSKVSLETNGPSGSSGR